jgi:hypothetical protein
MTRPKGKKTTAASRVGVAHLVGAMDGVVPLRPDSDAWVRATTRPKSTAMVDALRKAQRER